MPKAKRTNKSATSKTANTLDANPKDGETREATLARLALGPGPRHAAVGNSFASSLFSDNHQMDISASTRVIGDAMAKARDGDKTLASNILAAQAVALDTMFTELARRSAVNMGEYINAAERYMKLALKAQANCRTTLEALTKLHQPREQTVKHVHVNEGGQAVVADNFHQHTGEGKNEKSNEQSHATGSAGECTAMLGQDAQGNGVPITSCERPQKVQDARRNKSGCT